MWRAAARHILTLACDVASPRADAVVVVTDFHFDGVPATVFLSRRGIPQVVLLAQLVSDVRRRRVEVPRVPNQLGAASAVVGQIAQRGDVHGIGARRRPPTRLVRRLRRRTRPSAAASRNGKRKRERNRRPPLLEKAAASGGGRSAAAAVAY